MTEQPYTPINPAPEPPKPKTSRTATIITGVVALIVGVIIGASAGGGNPAPAARPGPATTTEYVQVPGPDVTVTAPPKAAPEPAASDTCGAAREAFLTGSPDDITSALRALQADKGADPTAREYADYYLDRDKDDPDMQSLDKGLIQSACGIL